MALSEAQVQTLLGYQNPINKFVNWNLTRAQVSHSNLSHFTQITSQSYSHIHTSHIS
jgi:hypothetical protein